MFRSSVAFSIKELQEPSWKIVAQSHYTTHRPIDIWWWWSFDYHDDKYNRTSELKCYLSKYVGIGSSVYNLGADFMITWRTWSSVACLKIDKWCFWQDLWISFHKWARSSHFMQAHANFDNFINVEGIHHINNCWTHIHDIRKMCFVPKSKDNC